MLGLKDTVVFADKLMYTGLRVRNARRRVDRHRRHDHPGREEGHPRRGRDRSAEIQQQYQSGLVTAGERYNKVVDIWSRTNERVAKAMMDAIGTDTVTNAKGETVAQKSMNSVFIMADSAPWFAGADPPAGRHARPDGQAGRLDHRDADHRELPRRPERPAVLHLDPRCP
jgi:DNA-directed RNA polymerase beta' subunit